MIFFVLLLASEITVISSGHVLQDMCKATNWQQCGGIDDENHLDTGLQTLTLM